MRANGFLAGAAAAIFLAFAVPAHALGPSGEVRVLAPETYPYGAPWDPDRPASAFNATRNEFLAVGEGRLPAGGYGVVVRRTLADGSPTGPVTAIADRQPTYDDIPAVAYDSEHDDYLVAWADPIDPDDPYSYHAIFGQRLDGDGTKLGEPFMVSAPAEWARQPAIAYDATRGRYLVAWSNAAGQDVIMARTVGPGDAMGAEETVSVTGSYSAEFPAVARDDDHDTFLVTWASYQPAPPGHTHFFAQLLDGDGAHADAGPDLKLSEQGLGPSVPQASGLAYNPVEAEFLAAFPEYGDHGAQEIALQRIGSDGAKQAGTSNVVLPGEGSNPQVSYAEGRYLVTFDGFVRSGTSWWGIGVIRGTLLDGHADPLPGQSEAQLSECGGKAALTYGAGRWMLSWYGGGRRTGDDTALLDLRSQMASADAEPSTATACPHPPAADPDPGTGPESTPGPSEDPATGTDVPPGHADSNPADPDRLQPRIVSASIRRRARRLSLIVRTSEEARLEVVLERRKIGRRSGKRCRATSRRNRGLPRCVRRISAGRLSSTVGPDQRRLTLAKLPAGAYSATLVAVDAAGNTSAPMRLRFRSPGR